MSDATSEPVPSEQAHSEQAPSFPGAFCEPCNKWRKPSMLMPDGSCPKCRTVLEAPDPIAPEAAAQADQEARSVKIPWHFWVMVAATVIYLGWRLIQGIAALF